MLHSNLPRKSFDIAHTNKYVSSNLNVVFINKNGDYMDYPHKHLPSYGTLPSPSTFSKIGLDFSLNNSSHLFSYKEQLWLAVVLTSNTACIKTGNVIGNTIKQTNSSDAIIFNHGNTLPLPISIGINDALYDYKSTSCLEKLYFFGSSNKKSTTIKNIIVGSNYYRDLTMMPSNLLGPNELSKSANSLCNIINESAGKNVISMQNYSSSELKSYGYNLLPAVGDSNPNNPPLLITIKYIGDETRSNELDKLIIGKGINMDTGGINIKSTAGIASMKMDMAGSALGLGTLYSLAMNKTKLNVALVIPTAYNLISSTAMNTGDVYTSGDTSVEITNTDAEGRLVLADAIGFSLNVMHLKPKSMYTLATLTLAGKAALGHWFTPYYTNKPMGEIKKTLINTVTDPLFKIPLLDDHLKVMQTSKVADLTNNDPTLSGAGGATAAAFIGHFVPSKTPWLHLDFGSTVSNVPDLSGNKKGAKEATGRCFLPMYEMFITP